MLPYILSFLSILGFGFFIVKRPTIETYILYVLFALPFVELKILPSYYGGFKAFDIISYAALLILFKEFVAIKGKGNTRFYFIFSILFIVITALGKLYSEFIDDSVYVLLQLLPIFIFSHFLILYCQSDSKSYSKVISGLKKGFIIALIFIAFQIVFGLGFSFYEELNPNTFHESSSLIRFPGFFDDSQVNGQYLAVGSFIFLIAGKTVGKKKKMWGYLLFVLTIFGIFLSGSRAPLGGFLLGCIFIILFSSKKVKTYAVSLLIIGALIGLVFIPNIGIFSRTKNLTDDFLFRESIWLETIEILEERPFLGIGLGNYSKFTQKYNPDLYLEIRPGEIVFFDQPENGYLKILVEHGILAFIIFLSFLAIPLLKNLKGLQSGTDQATVFLMASILSWLVAFNTVYSISDYRLLIVVVTCLGLLISNTINHDQRIEVSGLAK